MSRLDSALAIGSHLFNRSREPQDAQKSALQLVGSMEIPGRQGHEHQQTRVQYETANKNRNGITDLEKEKKELEEEKLKELQGPAVDGIDTKLKDINDD